MQLSDQRIATFVAPYETPDPFFSAKEIAKLREVLRISIGGHADDMTEDELSEFGRTMLEATAVAFKARASKASPLEVKNNSKSHDHSKSKT